MLKLHVEHYKSNYFDLTFMFEQRLGDNSNKSVFLNAYIPNANQLYKDDWEKLARGETFELITQDVTIEQKNGETTFAVVGNYYGIMTFILPHECCVGAFMEAMQHTCRKR